MALRAHHKALLGTALLVVAGGWGWSWITGATGLPVAAEQAPLAGGAASAPSAVNVALPERMLVSADQAGAPERIRSRRADGRPLFADDQALEQARQRQVLFATGDVIAREVADSPLANDRRLKDGRRWIRYDMEILAARAEGDQFLLPVMGGEAQEAEIEAVEVIQGQYRWTGRLLGPDGGTFHISQAFGDRYAVGSIKTTRGEYLLEVKDGKGWVAESSKEFVLPPDGNDTVSADGVGGHHPHAHPQDRAPKAPAGR